MAPEIVGRDVMAGLGEETSQRCEAEGWSAGAVDEEDVLEFREIVEDEVK